MPDKGSPSRRVRLASYRAAVTGAIDLLEIVGPALGRPTVDRVNGSKFHSMRELRPAGTSIRILFIFDLLRQAILLLGGNKARRWKSWYDKNIPVAERLYEDWSAGSDDDAQHGREIRAEAVASGRVNPARKQAQRCPGAASRRYPRPTSRHSWASPKHGGRSWRAAICHIRKWARCSRTWRP
ncbi:type II toxin-antitoxin system RelE/ParE family toxin [Mycobacteroides abscessus subsp. bolletii]|nr:type II toxin-antitoxin system RelE/ParE family toxin [Mycobacteroides abscessus subsp. bolletii]